MVPAMTVNRIYCEANASINAGRNGLSASTHASPMRVDSRHTVPVDFKNSNRLLLIVRRFIEYIITLFHRERQPKFYLDLFLEEDLWARDLMPYLNENLILHPDL